MTYRANIFNKISYLIHNYLLLNVLALLFLFLAWHVAPYLMFIAWIPILWACHTQQHVWHFYLPLFGVLFAWNFVSLIWLKEFFLFGFWAACFVNACLMMCAWIVSRWLWRRYSPSIGLLTWGVTWLGLEYMHLHTEIGFPWFNLGHVFATQADWVQWYEYTGVLGGTIWIIGSNILGYLIFSQAKSYRLRISALSLLWISIPILFSYSLLPSNSKQQDTTSLNLLITQPNLEQTTKQYKWQLNRYLKQLSPVIDSTIDCILFPELTSYDQPWIKQISMGTDHSRIQNGLSSSDAKIYYGTNLLVSHSQHDSSKVLRKTDYHRYNAIVEIDHSSPPIALSPAYMSRYIAKKKFIPFQERIPWELYWFPYPSVHYDIGETSKNFKIKTQNVSTQVRGLICYESLFGEYCAESLKSEVQMLWIFANEDFMAGSEGSQRYLDLARLRAIETRRFVVRSANRGSSSIIDPSGKIIAQTADDMPDHLRAVVPLLSVKTFYSRYGDWIGRWGIGLGISMLLFFLCQNTYLVTKTNDTDSSIYHPTQAQP